MYSIYSQAFLQVFEREVKDIFQNFHNKFDKTISKTPGIRLVRRIVDRLRGTRKVIFTIKYY